MEALLQRLSLALPDCALLHMIAQVGGGAGREEGWGGVGWGGVGWGGGL